VELACVDLATARLGEAGIARLEQALQLERSSHEAEFSPAAHDLHVVIAEVTGNRVLALIVLVLARLSLLHHRDGRNRAPSPEVERDVIAIHESIVEAIVANDAQLARFRMRRHLDAMQAYLR
jgi:DNA-binding FadR family transcriptional regulator